MGKSKRPIGIIEGRLYPCPKAPRCVSTRAKDIKHKMEPIKFNESLTNAKEKIIKIIDSLERSKIIANKDNYIHAEFRTATFKFVDDTEFLFDDDKKIIHFRSGARWGGKDWGVNRKRMENITKLFNNL